MTEHCSLHCPYASRGVCCTGPLGGYPYEEQLFIKRERLAKLFAAAKVTVPVERVVASDTIEGSRYKAKFVVGGYAHEPRLGVVDTEANFTELGGCMLHTPEIRAVAAKLPSMIAESGIRPYSISKRSGDLKFAIVRQAYEARSIAVRLVVQSLEQEARLRKLVASLRESFDQVVTVSINIQPRHEARLEGDDEFVWEGSEYIADAMGGEPYYFTPRSFAQVTPNVAHKLYDFVARRVSMLNPSSVMDLYCGTGLFALSVAGTAPSVVGIEREPSSIEAANLSAGTRKLKNIRFEVADAATLGGEDVRPDLIIVNPPRAGLGEGNEVLKNLGPKWIIYSSCEPTTLLKDLLGLQGYRLTLVQPFDMFPGVPHVETVCALERIEGG